MDWKILGHEWAVELLSQQIARGQVRQAYLFTGPRGVGRQLLALRLAQALNCPDPPQAGQPCLTCYTCTRLERMQHPDLMVVRAEEGSRVLKVEQVREVQHNLALMPYEARYKIALFLNFQDALASVPALLKTLETA
jgi:DNA polymerase-3 subunit delta'